MSDANRNTNGDDNDIGHHDGRPDPRIANGVSEPVNLLGETQRVRDPNRPGDYVPNTTPWIGIQAPPDPTPGAGLPDAQPEYPPHVDAKKVYLQRLEQGFALYEQLADNLQRNLRELRDLDPTHFDTHYPHLRKVHLPIARMTMDPHPGFTTFEHILATTRSAHRLPTAPGKDHLGRDKLSPAHPEYVTLTDEQKARSYTDSPRGWANMPRDVAQWMEVPWEEVVKATAEYNRRKAAQSPSVWERAFTNPNDPIRIAMLKESQRPRVDTSMLNADKVRIK